MRVDASPGDVFLAAPFRQGYDRVIRMLSVAGLLLGGRMLGCSCSAMTNPCSLMSGKGVVFIGRVVSEARYEDGGWAARVVVEEALFELS